MSHDAVEVVELVLPLVSLFVAVLVVVLVGVLAALEDEEGACVSRVLAECSLGMAGCIAVDEPNAEEDTRSPTEEAEHEDEEEEEASCVRPSSLSCR